MLAFTLLLGFVHVTSATVSTLFDDLDARQHDIRSLTAASDLSAIRRRSDNWELSHHASLAYTLDHGINNIGSAFASTVQLEGTRPILVLEELDQHFQRVQCIALDNQLHTVDLHFHSKEAYNAAFSTWGFHREFSIVTSHTSCNAEGERDIFKVVHLQSHGEHSLRLSVRPEQWQDAMKSIKVDFGTKLARDLHMRRHHDKRAPTAPSNLSITTANYKVTEISTLTTASSIRLTSSSNSLTSIAPASVNASATLPIPSTSPNKTLDQPFMLNLTHQKLHQSIVLPELPQVSFGCNNCSSTGSLEIVTGSFNIDLENAVTPGNVIQNGTVTLALPDGFQAYIALGINVTEDVDFNIPIIDVPIQGFTIPNIGKGGLYFSPGVDVHFQSNNAIQAGFGFEVDIPRNSSMTFDFGSFSNFTNSIVGFNETEVRALPATLNASIAGALTTSFQPNIVFGFELEPRKIDFNSANLSLGAQMTAAFDAPALTFNLSRQVDADLSCAPGTDNLTSIVSTDVTFGMGIEAGIYASGFPDLTNGTLTIDGLAIMLPSTSIPLFSKTVVAISTCVGVVKAGQTEGPVVITSATPSPTSTSVPRSSSATRTSTPSAKPSGGAASAVVADGSLFALAMSIAVLVLF